MAYSITPVLTTDTFQVWFDTTNQLVNAVSTVVVSVNTHANGGLTTGNGYVVGNFGASNLVGGTIRGGTAQTAANLTCTSNLAVTGATVTVGTVIINSSGISIAGIPLQTGLDEILSNTSGLATQTIDSFSKLTYRSAEYALTIRDNTANNWQFSKMLILHDDGNAFYTEYAIVQSNTPLGSFSATVVGSNVILSLTPTSSNTTVDGSRVLNDM